MFRAFKQYFKTLLNAIRGKQTYREVLVTEVKDIGFSAVDIHELKRIYPYKLYTKGCCIEELAVGAGEQRVIRSIETLIKRRSSELTIR